LYTTLVKSLSETQPDFGSASDPVDVQRYVEGRAHVPVDGDGDGELGEGELGEGELGDGDDGEAELGPKVGELVITEPPLHVTPFTAKVAGVGLLPVQEPLKPKETVALVPTEPL